ADPAGARRHADLVRAAVVADHGAHGVGTVSIVVAGFRGVRATTAAAAVHGVMPVVIVVCGGAVPAPILLLQRRVVPVVAGVLSGHHHALSGVAQGPDVVGV